MAANAPLEASNAAAMIQFFMVSPWRGSLLNTQFRALLPAGIRLLERVRELQHAEIVAIAADDLDAHRQRVAGEPGGNRDRRVAGDGDVVAALHPVEVV